ncbi:MAG TPA: DUF929 family protein [Acidimicrobiales bacterium]
MGLPTGVTPPNALSGQPPLTEKGKPAVVYIGGEFCPYCAVQRWALVVALSRFGTFTNLGKTISSSSTDVFPGLESWSFHGSSYSSPYVTFDAAEIYSSTSVTTSTPNGSSSFYAPLDKLTPLESQVFHRYDPDHGLAFVDIGNQATWVGAAYSPSILEGLSLDEIAANLSHPSSPVAQAIDGTANYMIASICHQIARRGVALCSNVHGSR